MFSPILGAYQDDVFATLIHPDMGNIGSPIVVSSNIVDDTECDVDGDGDRFLVTWKRGELISSSSDVAGRMLEVGAGPVGGPKKVGGDYPIKCV